MSPFSVTSDNERENMRLRKDGSCFFPEASPDVNVGKCENELLYRL